MHPAPVAAAPTQGLGFWRRQAQLHAHLWLATMAGAVAGATVLLSWLLLHTVFAMHYAHLF